MLKIRCPRCKSKLRVPPEESRLSSLYECPCCSWIIDLEKVKSAGRTILIASGKGGVGKSLVSSNLAIALARQGKEVVVIDANLGLANQHILMNVNTSYNLFHYVKGEKSLSEVILPTRWNVDLIKGSAEIHQISRLKLMEQRLILDKILELESSYDFTIIDLPTGILENTKFYFRIAKEVIVITGVSITSISDTFRLVKAIRTLNRKMRIGLIINGVKTKTEAEQIFDELANYCFRYHDVFIHSYGFIFDNILVDLSIQERVPLMILKPECNVAKCMREIAARVLGEERLHTFEDYHTEEEREELIKTFKHPPSIFLPEKGINERRTAKRAPLRERLVYSFLDTNSLSAEHRRGPGISENISINGVLFKSPDLIPKTKHLLITFSFDTGNFAHVSGKVVHNHIKDNKNRNYIGIAFNQFFGESREQIEKIVSAHS